MSSELDRFSLLPLVTAHYRSLTTSGRKHPSLWIFATLIVVPVGLAFAAVAWDFRLTRGAISPLLTASGLLVGVLLSSFVLLTNLRIKISESDKWSYQAKTIRLVAHTAASTMYLTAATLLLIAILLVGASLPTPAPTWSVYAGTVVTILLISHIGLTFSTVLRRLFGVYVSLFQADFDPVLELVAAPVESQAPVKKSNRRRSA
jgi:CDP-diglyceride synthetase